ncbi:MAG: hypothetical protein M1824_000890 [Vezdaea acicularis]|nr:MAG: hypothetical protein M1824_000890 [Vezdaea acicularis]
MPVEVIHKAPDAESFTPLSQHQSQTPESFFDGKPVLHYHTAGAVAVIPEDQTNLLPVFHHGASAGDLAPVPATSPAVNGQTETDNDGNSTPREIEVGSIEIWVTSERLIFYRASTATGATIPYPSINLHAIQQLSLPSTTSPSPSNTVSGLYMQISTHATSADAYDDEAVLEVTFVPSPSPSTAATVAEHVPAHEHPPSSSSSSASANEVQALFTALSTCSNLHPDPPDPDASDLGDENEDSIVFEGSVGYESGLVIPGNNSGDGGLPPPFPGSGGWITAENVGEHFDEEGNWRGGLGPEAGAGTTRGREEEDGEGEGGEETKWRRTE